MFFALSGFLVAGSAARLSFGHFLLNRTLRIVPALAVDIIICALILGPIFTTLDLSSYFSHPLFWGYFRNIFGDIHYYLPGVFEQNLSTKVNGALWTIPYEIGCYALLSSLLILRLFKRPLFVGVLAAGLPLLAILFDLMQTDRHIPQAWEAVLQLVVSNWVGLRLIPAFLMGIFFFQMRHRIIFDWRIAIVSTGLCLLAAFAGNSSWKGNPFYHLIGMPILTYIVIYIGLCKFPKLPLYSSGDYSYGIYLYHVPINQTVVSLIPDITPLAMFCVSLPIVTAVAAFSWHFVEKPILKLRKSAAFAGKKANKKASIQPAENLIAVPSAGAEQAMMKKMA